jgi:hypothetical protein
MSDFPVMEYKPMDGEEQIELTPHEGELEFWDKIMRSTRQPMQRRMKAAELGHNISMRSLVLLPQVR